jgi:hypothetical protein
MSVVDPDISHYGLPSIRYTGLILPPWLDYMKAQDVDIFNDYIEQFIALFTYIITNNKLFLPSTLRSHQASIFKAMSNQYTDLPSRLPTPVGDLEPVWFAKQQRASEVYVRDRNYTLVSRQISDTYDSGAINGVNLFISLDLGDTMFSTCPRDLYTLDFNLIGLLYNLIQIKINYLVRLSRTMNTAHLDPSQITFFDNNNYIVHNSYGGTDRINITHMREAYGLSDDYMGKRKSASHIDKFLSTQFIELFGFVQTVIRRQPTQILAQNIYASGVLKPQPSLNPVHILGYYESDTEWVETPSTRYNLCTPFASELIISGYFLRNQINRTLNFLYPPANSIIRTLARQFSYDLAMGGNMDKTQSNTKRRSKSYSNTKRKSKTHSNTKKRSKSHSNKRRSKTHSNKRTSKTLSNTTNDKHYTLDEIYNNLFLVKKSDIKDSITMTKFQQILYEIGQTQLKNRDIKFKYGTK